VIYAPGIESTHVVITLHAAIHDGSIALFPDALFCNIDIDPVGIAPHAGINLSKLDGRAGVVPDGLDEGGIEVSIVQEDVWVVKPPVKVSLHRLYRLQDTLQLFISCEYDEHGVGTRFSRFHVRIDAAGHEYFIVLLTDFSARKGKSAGHVLAIDFT